MSRKNRNVYIVAILSVDRREHSEHKHRGMLTIEQAFAKRKTFLELEFDNQKITKEDYEKKKKSLEEMSNKRSKVDAAAKEE